MDPAERTPKTENAYLTVISKRIKALNKKLTQVKNIEDKISSGKPVNEEQKQVLANKEFTQKSLAMFQAIKEQLTKIQEEEAARQANQTRDLVYLHQSSAFLQEEESRTAFFSAQALDKPEGGLTESDLDSVIQFSGLLLTKDQKRTESMSLALDHATKFLDKSEETVPGMDVTYKQLHERASAVYESKIFKSKPKTKSKSKSKRAPKDNKKQAQQTEEASQPQNAQETAPEKAEESKKEETSAEQQQESQNSEPASEPAEEKPVENNEVPSPKEPETREAADSEKMENEQNGDDEGKFSKFTKRGGRGSGRGKPNNRGFKKFNKGGPNQPQGGERKEGFNKGNRGTYRGGRGRGGHYEKRNQNQEQKAAVN